MECDCGAPECNCTELCTGDSSTGLHCCCKTEDGVCCYCELLTPCIDSPDWYDWYDNEWLGDYVDEEEEEDLDADIEVDWYEHEVYDR